MGREKVLRQPGDERVSEVLREKKNQPMVTISNAGLWYTASLTERVAPSVLRNGPGSCADVRSPCDIGSLVATGEGGFSRFASAFWTLNLLLPKASIHPVHSPTALLRGLHCGMPHSSRKANSPPFLHLVNLVLMNRFQVVAICSSLNYFP